MKKTLTYTFSFLAAILFFAFTIETGKTKVYLIGDSTMSIKSVSNYPETGWGMPFKWFFDESIDVDDRALNGRSTRTFFEEKKWTAVMDSLKAGDYVFIQFGHNDEVQTKRSATSPDEFVRFLTMYVNDSRSKQAIPVLITPVARRKFDSIGNLEDTHKDYAELVRKTAVKLDVPLIDLSEKSMALLREMGVENSKYLYNHLEPGQNPNYPKGKIDNTHFSEFGARRMAELVLAEIRKMDLPLKEHIVNRTKK